MLQHNPALRRAESSHLKHAPMVLSAPQRTVVADSIRLTCDDLDWSLLALIVRGNHVHLVIAAPDTPEKVMHALKSSATRRLREQQLVARETRPWSRHESTKYLWKPHQVEGACRYVAESQGEDIGGQL